MGPNDDMFESMPHSTAVFLADILNEFASVTNWILAKRDGLFLASKDSDTFDVIKEEAAQVATVNNIAEQLIELHGMKEPYLVSTTTEFLHQDSLKPIKSSDTVIVLVSLWNEYTLYLTMSSIVSDDNMAEQDTDSTRDLLRTMFKRFISECPISSANLDLKIDLIKAIPFILGQIRDDPQLLSVAIKKTVQLADSEEPQVRECLTKYLKEYLNAGIPADVILTVVKKLGTEIPEF